MAEKLIREGLGEAWTRDGQHRDLPVDLERDDIPGSNQPRCHDMNVILKTD